MICWRGEKLDFVDICAPPGSHAALIERALDAGLHVLSEKPLVTRVEDAKRVAGAAARAGRVLHTVHNWLEAPICRKISALVDEGAIGAVRSVRWRTLRTQPAIAVSADGVTNWRVDPAMAGGGVLFDHGWHALYCVMRWAGVPVGVAARLETRRFHEQPLEDTASVDLDTAAGVSNIFLTWAADERSNAIEIDGEQGEIRVVGDAVVLKSKCAGADAGLVRRPYRKGRTIPIGSAEWPPTLWLRRRAARRAIWTRRSYAPG